MQKILANITLLILLYCHDGSCQSTDSLLALLNQSKKTEQKIDLLIKIANDYYFNHIEKELSEKYLLQAKDLAIEQKDNQSLINVLNELGVFYRNTSRYQEALASHRKALIAAEKSNNKLIIAKTLNNIGVVYRRIDDHANAAEFHTKALRIAEEISDTFNISVSNNSLGNIYSLNGKYDEALHFFNKALSLSIQQNNFLSQAINYNNIGEVYEFMRDYEKAREFYEKSFEINIKIKNEKGIAISYNALGKIYLFTGNANAAYRYFTLALEIDKKIGDKKFIAESYLNIGRALFKLNNKDEAIVCINKTIIIAKEIHSLAHLQISYEELSNIYLSKSEADIALTFYKISSTYKDSLINEKSTRHISTIQALFENEKKEQEIQLLKQQQELNTKEVKKQKVINLSLAIGLIFSIVIITTIYNAFKLKREANKKLSVINKEIENKNDELMRQKDEIQMQNEEIDRQKESIENKNKNLGEAYQIIENYISKITDSIRYAEKIQKSIFPETELLTNYFKDYFVFYKPKDIVSGDFYWCSVRKDKLFFALADCTGHGVPGAFMSIIGIDLLNQAVNQYELNETNEILHFLNTELRRRLRREYEEVVLKDSMDIALISYKKTTGEISYSGALIPAFLLKDNTIIEYKPDHTSLGMSTKIQNTNFTIQRNVVNPGDWIYLTTDGYLDQFGGEKNQKFMRKRLIKMINCIKDLPAEYQKEELEKTYLNWKGKNEQIDDVLVWGIRF